MVRLVCGNCGISRKFQSWQEAYDIGWDTVAWMGYNSCEKCPGVSVYLPTLHAQEAREETDPEKKRLLLEKAAALTLEFEPKPRRDAFYRIFDNSGAVEIGQETWCVEMSLATEKEEWITIKADTTLDDCVSLVKWIQADCPIDMEETVSEANDHSGDETVS